MLPLVDGLAVCRTIRQSGQRVPILILTARDAVDDRVEGLDAGADDYLVKPFRPSQLVERIEEARRRKRLQRALRAPVTDSIYAGLQSRIATTGPATPEAR